MSDSYFEDEDSGKSSGFLFKVPTVLWDRRWFIIIPTVITGVAGVAASIIMPTTYESKATLLVESSELAKDNGTNTSEAVDRRIAKIRQQLLSRPDLIELIQKYGLYKSSDKGELLSKLVERMRGDTTIEAIDADIGGANVPSWSKGQNGSIAFSLSFSYSRPDLTQMVAQNFVDKLLKLDTETLQGEAKLNLKLLTDQEADLQNQLSAINSQINTIAGQGGSSLVSAPIMAMGGGAAGYQTQIAELRRQNIQLSSQLGSSGISRDPGVVAAEAQLSAARSIYADNHPDVKLAEARLAAARSAAANFETKSLSGSVAQQIAANNATIAQLSAALNAENGRTAAMAAAQARGPEFAQHLAQLTAQADLIRSQLGRIQSSVLSARANAEMTEQRKGERLTVIEAPALPDHPKSPNRPLLIFGGLVAGALVGLVIAMAVELILSPIRSVQALAKATGAPPLAVVPIIKYAPSKGIFGKFLGKKSSKRPSAKEK